MGGVSEAHDWFIPKGIAYECCRKCGIVRRRDDKNSPCKGVVKIVLRGLKIERAQAGWWSITSDDGLTTINLEDEVVQFLRLAGARVGLALGAKKCAELEDYQRDASAEFQDGWDNGIRMCAASLRAIPDAEILKALEGV